MEFFFINNILQRRRRIRNLILQLEAEDEKIFHAIQAATVKTYNPHPKYPNYASDWVFDYSPPDFFRLYRMTLKTFNRLHALTVEKNPEYHRGNVTGREPVSSTSRLLITIEYLAAQGPLRKIGDKFGIADSTVYNIVEETLDILIAMQSTYIKWPSADEAEEIKAEFRDACGFPGVIGAIDGSHIEVKVAAEHIGDYTNRKCFQSVILQGCCTYSKLFTHINVGFPGRAHDARVLQYSDLWRIAETQEDRLFYGSGHLIGDSAYPLRNWLMVPYKRHNGLLPEEYNYNRRLSRGRVCIENTFGWLKSRWRRLLFIDVNSLDKITKVITACFVLHNFCLLHDDYLPENDLITIPQMPVALFIGPQPVNATGKRNMLKQLLA